MDRKNWVYGASINTTVSKKLSLFANYQSSYNMEEYYLDRSLLDGCMSYSPNKNYSIEILGRYNLIKNSLDVKELAFMVKFVHTFNIPVSKKKNIGKLSGKVINKGVKNIEGVVLSVGTDQAVTDKDGNYSFPMLPAGNYYMMDDYPKAGVNAITEMPSPYQIEMQPGIETKFDIGLTLSSKISGEILIVKEVATTDKTYAEIRNKLVKLMIEAKNEGEVFRIFTTEDGKFSFEGLRPGPWTVKVYEHDIPKEYELVTDLFNLSLALGDSKYVEVKIKEKRRRIKFQKSFDNTPPVSETSAPIARASDQSDRPKINTKALTETKDSDKTLEYRVQIGANKGQKLSLDWLSNAFRIDQPIQEDYFNSYYVYTIGSFPTRNQAQKLCNTLVAMNKIAGAFVVAFSDGKRCK